MNIILVQVSNVTLMDDMSLEEVEEIEGIPVFRDTVMFTNGLLIGGGPLMSFCLKTF